MSDDYLAGNLASSMDDMIKPFMLESSHFRGRIVRLGAALDGILGAHDYPEPVAHLVGEMAVLALLLSSMLKFDGIFTLQAQGDGPINMLVADVTSDGKLRACASYQRDRLESAGAQLASMQNDEGSANHLAQYLGKGYIAFTVDQSITGGERYQGIVELQGASLVDCVQHYFTQSEQIGTGIKMAIGQRDGQWRAGGIMLQKMPEEGGVHVRSNQANLEEDDWRRAMVFLGSCTENEFLDPLLSVDELLMRLFNEEGVRVFEPRSIIKECRCSEERVLSVLAMLDRNDRDYMEKSGVITMTCEFCSHEYAYEAVTIEKKIEAYLQKKKNKAD